MAGAETYFPHLLCCADGKTTLHALGSLEARGSLFTGVATEVYQGMVSSEDMSHALHLPA